MSGPMPPQEKSSSVDGVPSDFFLNGKQFEGLRTVATRIAGAKTLMERVLTRVPQVPEGSLSHLTDERFEQLCIEMSTFNKQCGAVGTLPHKVYEQFEGGLQALKCLQEYQLWAAGKRDGAPGVQHPESCRSFLIVQNLLMIEGFFSSVFWFFCLPRAAVTTKRADEVLGDERFEGWWFLRENNSGWSRDVGNFNLMGASILTLLIQRWPRLCIQLWKCPAFLWGLKSLIQWQATEALIVKKKTDVRGPQFAYELNSLYHLLAALVNQKMYHKEAVDALNISAPPPGVSKEEKEDLDFSDLIRASYWSVVAGLDAQGNERVNPCQEVELNQRLIRLMEWGSAVRLLGLFSTVEVEQKSERA
uniref:Uncharacterized protein n=1 Tax=Chromera velia CCMP2878 TaxID=1169474 RepID=A0A0G4IFZ0_9ALVE|eukprot:Cvel_14051.t1-p1 / transcript=Cvel_14051.t1 / gene=Cvel_14051 / organism=Chromera_velia_CCMP2878 / gene_product=hypothetical protein / transcript_product=hypothetical protein / location=Cvel_scaffold985:25898-26977(-) / protein_length=360 / sequence_SO=supercontig / SO=protein_coding / is_pseudo=false